jgi:hypothetical protein
MLSSSTCSRNLERFKQVLYFILSTGVVSSLRTESVTCSISKSNSRLGLEQKMAAFSGSGSGSNCIFTEHGEWAESQRGRDYFNEVTERQATGTRHMYNRGCVTFYTRTK